MGNSQWVGKRFRSGLTVILLVVSIFGYQSGSAQNTAIGFRGGISIPNLSSSGSDQNPLNTGYSSRLGPEFSVFAEFKISELFSVETMVEYSSQGGKKNGLQAFTIP
jgi:hypothetical protein